jgi:hypothetical protein
VLQEKGSLAESERAYRSALEILSAALGEEHIRVTMPLVGLARVLDARGRPAEAVPLLERSLRMRLRTFGAEHSLTVEVEGALGGSLLRMKRYAAAEPYLTHVERVLAAATPPDAKRLAGVRAELALARERGATSAAAPAK